MEKNIDFGALRNPTERGDAAATSDGEDAIFSRYTDAYLVANSITQYGSTVKLFALVIGVLVILGGVVMGMQGDAITKMVGGVFMSFVIALPIYILGVFLSAQGQILKATLDTAVNTSQFLDKDAMRKMMSLD